MFVKERNLQQIHPPPMSGQFCFFRQRSAFFHSQSTNPEADSFHWLYSYFSLSVGGCGERHEYEPVIFLYWMVSYQKMREMSCWEVLRTTAQILFPEVLRQQNWLWVYGEKQLAGLKTCKLPSKNLRFTAHDIRPKSGWRSSARNRAPPRCSTGCPKSREKTRCGLFHPAKLRSAYASIILLKDSISASLRCLQ